jgi:hypothetical protein
MLLTQLGLNVLEYLERQNGKKTITFEPKVHEITITQEQLKEEKEKLEREDRRTGPLPRKIILINNRDLQWVREVKEAKERWERHHEIRAQNKKEKNNFPKCENCFKACYLSSHATKLVCQKEPLYYCYKCYNTELEVLDNYRNRRRCPYHENCVAFESKSDRKKYNNEDDEWTDYFRDPTKCPEHPEIKLITPNMLCYICDEDDTEIELFLDEQEQRQYDIAARVVAKYFQEKEPEKLEKQGSTLDAFYMKDTKLQAEVKNNKRKWEESRKNAEGIFEKLIPEEYFWMRKKIKEFNQEDQILYEIQQLLEVGRDREEIKICMGCLNVAYQGELLFHPDQEWICKRCSPGVEHRMIQPEHDKDWNNRASRGYRQRENKRMKSRLQRGIGAITTRL